MAVGEVPLTRGKERAKLGSWTPQLVSVCQKQMAGALFGSGPEKARKENSLRGRDPGSIVGHPIMEKEEAQGKNIQGSMGNQAQGMNIQGSMGNQLTSGPAGLSGPGRKIGKARTR